MEVLAVGKEHRSGVSKKNGNPYDCTVAHTDESVKRKATENFAKTMLG